MEARITVRRFSSEISSNLNLNLMEYDDDVVVKVENDPESHQGSLFFGNTLTQAKKCSFCNNIFSTDVSLKQHCERFHNKNKRYECPECGGRFVRITTINKHFRDVHSLIQIPNFEEHSIEFKEKQQKETSTLKRKNVELDESAKRTKRDCDLAHAEMKSLTIENDKIESDLKEKSIQLIVAADENRRLKKDLECLRNTKKELIEKYEAQCKSLEKKLSEAINFDQNEKKKLKQESEEKNQQLQIKYDELVLETEKNQLLQTRCDELASELVFKCAENIKLKKNLSNIEEELETIKSDMTNMQSDFDKLQQVLFSSLTAAVSSQKNSLSAENEQ